MKKGFLTCLAVAFLLMSFGSSAMADGGGLYVAAKAGLGYMRGDESFSHNQSSEPNNSESGWSNSAFNYGAALGYNWLDEGVPLRTEVEYYDHGTVTMRHDDDNATFEMDTDIQTVQLNIFYDFYTKTNFIPYLGAGFGIAQLDTDGETTSNFCYSLFAGTAYKLTDMIMLDLTYRINQFGDSRDYSWSDTNNDYTVKAKNLFSIEGTLGVRIQF
ncbi:outer membrane protein [Pseudodesulfovibrio piezophilus]|uniref:Outer membrane protein beta-barrel domain-containing protein n=1 Tax=Pseudodesulfovibrio piezophilus (strain DSM 21447 / JCM 15486 / C1TLV30) TaxID=1322246 RepID=M1WPW2_PSEP2|nr:outer membrane beta-barrel protein [Pseudodesulfovibrio piezophilus]CCH48624.1 exported protein of unknown function [Pseudodesulfovibrio piezophilus C1TLV30]